MSPALRQRTGLAHALVSAALGLACDGCEADTACVEWLPTQGACPSPEEALHLMTPRPCGGRVASVDGPGVFDYDACCYPVTERSEDFGICQATNVTSSSASGTGPGCISCGMWLADESAPSSALCPKGRFLAERLVSCICDTTCQAECGATTCAGSPGPSECATCAETLCTAELEGCTADP